MNRIGDRRDAIRACAGIVLALLGDVAVARADDGDTSTAPDAVALRPVAAAPPPVGPASDMIRVPRPVVPPGPRRVGIQAGHWKMAEVPDEMARLAGQTGTSAAGFVEWQVNLDIAGRVATRLRSEFIDVDIDASQINKIVRVDLGVVSDAAKALREIVQDKAVAEKLAGIETYLLPLDQAIAALVDEATPPDVKRARIALAAEPGFFQQVDRRHIRRDAGGFDAMQPQQVERRRQQRTALR